MSVAYISHHACLLHAAAQEHPEQPARLTAIEDTLASSGVLPDMPQYEAPRVKQSQLERVHFPDYVFRLFAAAPADGVRYLDHDTYINPHTVEAAKRAAGAVVHGVDLVMQGEVDSAFCAVRPPGHHAEPHRAMGFCIFNNIAVGAAHAMEEYGLERVAIVDFDIHHGNGTEEMFQDDPRVLLCSSFQSPFFPFTGVNTRSDHVLNVMFPAATDSATYRERVADSWFPALDSFRPQMILFSAGFDAHADDPLGQLLLDESDFAWITGQIKAIADKHAQGRMVSTLEGGYDLLALGRSVVAHVKALQGEDAD